MKYDLAQAQQRVHALDQQRIQRAKNGSTDAFAQFIELLPLLLQVNHPNLPGFVPNLANASTPVGVAKFQLNSIQRNYLSQHLSATELNTLPLQSEANAPILGIYVMGSFGSISQTASSDLDTWICYDSTLDEAARNLLQQKLNRISRWAAQQNVEVHFYLVDQQRFRDKHYHEPLTKENSGSAQYMLLLEEFYRSAVRLAGKPLLWLHLWHLPEADYENEVARLIGEGEINPEDWVDFGGLGQFSAEEYFGAGLWQLYKGVDAPYKSVLKILLLEVYATEYPHTQLIASQFKQDLAQGLQPAHQFDPYIAILNRVTDYLNAHHEVKRLRFVRGCLYVKVMEDFSRHQLNHWRIAQMQQMASQWGWSADFLQELNRRPFWKVKRVKQSHNNVVNFLMMSYQKLLEFGRKHKLSSSVIPQDMAILSRKLYTAFEELPDKVTLLNRQISRNLAEAHLTFVEVRGNKHFKDGWYMLNQPPQQILFSKQRVTEYAESLNKLVVWAYFNRLLTAKTQLHLLSDSLQLETLRDFVADLRLSFPSCELAPEPAQFAHQCEIRNLCIAINLTNDPTAQVEELKSNISPSDLFSFGPHEQSLVGSIDLTYRNIWNEIRSLHFAGQNAILQALKVLSNKIHRGVSKPASVQVFCYSRHYQRPLRNLVSNLVNRCISIQLGDSQPAQYPRLRVAGKNWQFFFEERGISLQEVAQADKDCSACQELVEQSPVAAPKNPKRNYPAQIDLFASEGFLQFFFEDNPDHSFNVYILDEANRIEIYRHCDGEKDDKVREINRIYQSSDGSDNPYNIVQRNFNYPQFYQLVRDERCDAHCADSHLKIVPFRFKAH